MGHRSVRGREACRDWMTRERNYANMQWRNEESRAWRVLPGEAVGGATVYYNIVHTLLGHPDMND